MHRASDSSSVAVREAPHGSSEAALGSLAEREGPESIPMAEQLKFVCMQLHFLGVARHINATPPDVARFTWEAATALAEPFGYISTAGMQALLEQDAVSDRLVLLCGLCQEAASR